MKSEKEQEAGHPLKALAFSLSDTGAVERVLSKGKSFSHRENFYLVL